MIRRKLLGITLLGLGGGFGSAAQARPSQCPEAASGLKYEYYMDTDKKWRWRLWSRNGNIIADSGQGYDSKQGLDKGILLVKASFNAPVVPESPTAE